MRIMKSLRKNHSTTTEDGEMLLYVCSSGEGSAGVPLPPAHAPRSSMEAAVIILANLFITAIIAQMNAFSDVQRM